MEKGKIAYCGPPQPNFLNNFLKTTKIENCFVKKSKKLKEIEDSSKRLIKLEDILHEYKENGFIFTLEISELSIYKGEVLAVIGPNGSGKTTLAKLIAGLVKPKKGRILKFSPDISVGMVFQNPEIQLFNATVYDEVTFNLKSEAEKETVETLLKDLGFSSKRNLHPQSLSQGEKRRLAFASVLASNPKVIILDEPSTGQDCYHLSLLINKLELLKKKGKAVILITHELDLVNKIADKVVILENGKIVEMLERGTSLEEKNFSLNYNK